MHIDVQTPETTPEINEPLKPTMNSDRPPRWPHKRIHWWLKRLSRKQFALVVVIFLALAGGAGYYIWQWRHGSALVPFSTVTKVPKSDTVPSRMTGRQVSPALNALPVTAVMIENSQDARPQSGLAGADMVIEAIAEGGITRFMALYQESQPTYIGPVRSVRPYYLDFAAPYQASIAHAGGSGKALAQLHSEGLRDLDYAYNPTYYHRITARFAPHNVYTSRAELLKLQRAKGYNKSSYTGFARKPKETPADKPTVTSIDFIMSNPFFNPHFTYSATTNNYLRSEGGVAHSDQKTGKRIAPKVVIAMVTDHHYSGIYSIYRMRGKGKARIFQDGKVIHAIWRKNSRREEMTLRDGQGNNIPLDPGQTWITLVASLSDVHAK